MGVDWSTCSNPECGESYPDCGDYFYCSDEEGGCGHGFCSDDCGGRQEKDGKVSCVLCREELVTDSDLIEWLAFRRGMTREALVAGFRLRDRDEWKVIQRMRQVRGYTLSYAETVLKNANVKYRIIRDGGCFPQDLDSRRLNLIVKTRPQRYRPRETEEYVHEVCVG